MARVTLKDVTKRYGAVEAVHQVCLDIPDGELAVLVGPSGCGKSTTLRMVAGLEEISDGEISIGERVVNEVLPKDRDIAMVFQSYALYPHMSVRQNLAFGLKMRRTPRAEIDEQVPGRRRDPRHRAALDRKPKQLSRRAAAAGGHGPRHRADAPRCSSSTSPSPTWTPSCGCRCAPRSPGSTAGSRPRSSM